MIDVAHSDIHPCMGCDYCGMAGPCCQKDDMSLIRDELLNCDLVVFVTPLYYFGMSAQLKKVIDRFYSFNGELTSKKLKSILICAAWNNDNWTMVDIQNHYQTLCHYLDFQNVGMILGVGCGTVNMTKSTSFPQQAYQLGKSL